VPFVNLTEIASQAMDTMPAVACRFPVRWREPSLERAWRRVECAGGCGRAEGARLCWSTRAVS